MSRSLAQRRYVIRVALSMVAYLATLYLAKRLIDAGAVHGPAAVAVALIPGLCITGVFWALARHLIEETDEFLRMVLVRQVLIASAVALTAMTVWETLTDFGLVDPPSAYYSVWLLIMGLALGEGVTARVYGARSC